MLGESYLYNILSHTYINTNTVPNSKKSSNTNKEQTNCKPIMSNQTKTSEKSIEIKQHATSVKHTLIQVNGFKHTAC